MSHPLFTPLTLPNGTLLPNRIVKAAMEEHMAGPAQLPTDQMIRLYETWARGGAGMLLTGNVMINPRALTGPGAVCLQKGTDLEPFRRWSQAVRKHGAHIWMQISHPGRQVWAAHGQPGWAPSEVAVDLGKHSSLMAQPRAMTESEIEETITRFADTAQQAEAAGFHGVEIHAAHGYLISQFLSPLTNRRSDRWGGSLENRARLLMDVVARIRSRVAPSFCLGVKLNSADFQRGGFDASDTRAVVAMLNDVAVDLVELSGGSYEAPAMQGQTRDGRTLAREAFFLEFAADIAKTARMPLMTTGGIRRLQVAEEVLAQGVAVVGMGTALAMCPELPQHWRAGREVPDLLPNVKFQDKVLAALANMAIIRRQLQRMGAGKQPKRNAHPLFSVIRDRLRTKRLTGRYLKWIAQQPAIQGN